MTNHHMSGDTIFTLTQYRQSQCWILVSLMCLAVFYISLACCFVYSPVKTSEKGHLSPLPQPYIHHSTHCQFGVNMFFSIAWAIDFHAVYTLIKCHQSICSSSISSIFIYIFLSINSPSVDLLWPVSINSSCLWLTFESLDKKEFMLKI